MLSLRRRVRALERLLQLRLPPNPLDQIRLGASRWSVCLWRIWNFCGSYWESRKRRYSPENLQPVKRRPGPRGWPRLRRRLDEWDSGPSLKLNESRALPVGASRELHNVYRRMGHLR